MVYTESEIIKDTSFHTAGKTGANNIMNDHDSSNNVIHMNHKMGERYENKNKRPHGHPAPRVISIASGKGGVGKTNIVANLGYAFCKLGKKVLIFDADLGLGNLDILLGLTPKYNLSHVVIGEKKIEEVIVDGPAEMKIIPAASGIQELVHLSKKQKMPILIELEELISKFDIFLIDTAAGISSNVLHFNAIAQEILIIISPEPTSITDAYALIKVLSYQYSTKSFNLIVNMAKSSQEARDVYRQLKLVTNRFLDISLAYTGYVLVDENITKGVKLQKMVSELYPDSVSCKCFASIAKKICATKVINRPEESTNLIWQNIFGYNH